MPFLRWFSVVIAVCLLAACGSLRLSPYRIDVRQGNMVTQDMAAKLKPGMTKDQVRFVLGTPLITDIFHADRWDYVYRFQPGWGEVQERKFTVYFADGRLARVAGDVAPAGEGAAAEAAPAAPLPADPSAAVAPAESAETERVPADASAPAAKP